jgi:hypothetical protein
METKRKPIPGSDGELNEALDTHHTGHPLPDYSAAKPKGRDAFRPRFPEYHFSVALPVDLAITALHDQVDLFNDDLPADILTCETSRLDVDRARFMLATRDWRKTGVRLTGTMQRWEGNHTRLDVAISLHAGGQFTPFRRSLRKASSPTDSTNVLGLSALMLVIFYLLADNSDYLQVLLLLAFLIIMWAFPLEWRLRQRPGSEQHIYAAQRDANALTDLLINAFSDYDVRWINKT